MDVEALDGWRETQEKMTDRFSWGFTDRRRFRLLSSIRRRTPRRDRKSRMSTARLLEKRYAELRSVDEGGLSECRIRALLYVGRARGMVDERGLEALRRMRREDAASR